MVSRGTTPRDTDEDLPNQPLRRVLSAAVHPDIERVLLAFDHHLSAHQEEQLDRYMAWLRREAILAGGLGPDEARHLENRHIADSLLYLPPSVTGSSLLDLGSGVGLPGLVLAIAHPALAVTLIDRSGRRVDLMKRAVRVTGVSNAVAIRADLGRDPIDPADLVTMRAVFPPDVAIGLAAAHALRHAVIGLSRRRPPADFDALAKLAHAAGFEARLHESEILEPPSWLLIMTRV